MSGMRRFEATKYFVCRGVSHTTTVTPRAFVRGAPSKSPPVGEALAAVAFDFFKVLPTGEDLGGALNRCNERVFLWLMVVVCDTPLRQNISKKFTF